MCDKCGRAIGGKSYSGRCQPCYRRARRIEQGLPVRLSVGERFRQYYSVSPDGCWEWAGVLDQGGYAKFSVDGRQRRAHRWAYSTFVGPIPEGMVIDHLCRVRHCVNPAHMEVVTPAVNTLRGIAPNIVAHVTGVCQRGHEFTPENTYVRPDGTGSMCKTCINERQRRRRAAA